MHFGHMYMWYLNNDCKRILFEALDDCGTYLVPKLVKASPEPLEVQRSQAQGRFTFHVHDDLRLPKLTDMSTWTRHFTTWVKITNTELKGV
jgi:hypothetical protein